MRQRSVCRLVVGLLVVMMSVPAFAQITSRGAIGSIANVWLLTRSKEMLSITPLLRFAVKGEAP
jgi:hypothetical protein